MWDAWGRNIFVCHTFVSPWFACVGVSCSLFFWFCASPVVLSPPPFVLTRISCLAPMTRTLLGRLRHATVKFFVVAARCSWRTVCVLSFATAPNSSVRFFGGFLRAEKTISLFNFVGCASFSWCIFFPAAIARGTHYNQDLYIDQTTVALVILDGRKWEAEEQLWAPLLGRLTMTGLLLPAVPLYGLDPKEELLTKPRWQTAMYLVSGKNVSSNPMENMSEGLSSSC